MKQYFLFSMQYIKDRSIIENKVGKEFVLGTVVVNGTRKEYCFTSEDSTAFGKYNDARIVTYADPDKIKFIEPTTRKKKGL